LKVLSFLTGSHYRPVFRFWQAFVLSQTVNEARVKLVSRRVVAVIAAAAEGGRSPAALGKAIELLPCSASQPCAVKAHHMNMHALGIHRMMADRARNGTRRV